jgi:hypothetical protein
MSLSAVGVVVYLSSSILLAFLMHGKSIKMNVWSHLVSCAILSLLLYTGGFFS